MPHPEPRFPWRVVAVAFVVALEARGVAANADDIRLQRILKPLAPLTIVVAVVLLIAYAFWCEEPEDEATPRRARP